MFKPRSTHDPWLELALSNQFWPKTQIPLKLDVTKYLYPNSNINFFKMDKADRVYGLWMKE
jgi:hypothetical protein